ncbi:hypothetical protein I553_1347 [Mycobacterium xenopi 4042]|uniref:Uncharacterized protein n=1 Tax=Mycobacterium xenopi 4042 TaxID=1299334 RepID=X8CEQ8_MYCXE|nr:hypothetical protein I553_1347 [Mycobacterium xenopi 4042]
MLGQSLRDSQPDPREAPVMIAVRPVRSSVIMCAAPPHRFALHRRQRGYRLSPSRVRW